MENQPTKFDAPRANEQDQLDRLAKKSLAKLQVPPPVAPTAKEIARRRKVVADIIRFREELGPLPFSVDELIREDREDENG